jgi:hypothetical protein
MVTANPKMTVTTLCPPTLATPGGHCSHAAVAATTSCWPSAASGEGSALLAVRSGGSGNVSVRNLAMAGLPAASVVRTAKIATIETADAQRLGRVSASELSAVRQHLAAIVAAA